MAERNAKLGMHTRVLRTILLLDLVIVKARHVRIYFRGNSGKISSEKNNIAT